MTIETIVWRVFISIVAVFTVKIILQMAFNEAEEAIVKWARKRRRNKKKKAAEKSNKKQKKRKSKSFEKQNNGLSQQNK